MVKGNYFAKCNGSSAQVAGKIQLTIWNQKRWRIVIRTSVLVEGQIMLCNFPCFFIHSFTFYGSLQGYGNM
jgi:hypothetical protein